MKHRAVDVVLLLVILIGGVLAWRTDRTRSRLQDEYVRLSEITGELSIVDPSQVCIKALKTDDKMHYAWRVYFPPNYSQTLTTNTGSSHGSSSSAAADFIARVSFREDKSGTLQVFTRFAGGSSTMTVGDQELARLLRDRWNEVLVEQMGAEKVVTIDQSKAAFLLRLRLPSDLREATRTKLASSLDKSLGPVLFEIRLGRDAQQP